MLTGRIAQPFVFVALFLCNAATTSEVVVYEDTDCKTAVTTLVASNGYPDGLCTEVGNQTTRDFQSLQFLSLDSGCAATVYQAGADDDDDTCSGDAVWASLATCYNTSWVDFSVDECTTPVAPANSTSENATITKSPPAATSTASSSSSSLSSGAAPSSTESAKNNAPLYTLTQTGSMGLCSAIVLGMYFLLL